MESKTVMTGDVLDLKVYKTYGEYKAALEGELQRSAESFIRIGYLLKAARDTDILAGSGYSSVNEFAREEYGLDKSQVSRFIRINDEFSENGYSDRLQERYRSFGYAKLAMMLLLPEEINEELSADYSKAEIQAIKEEIDAERRITDLEVMLEGKDGRQQDKGPFRKVLHQIGKDHPELYEQLYDTVSDTVYDGTSAPVIDKMMDVLAPNGEAIITARIPGEGRKMLSIKGKEVDPVIVDVRSGEKWSCTWDELINDMEALCEGENGKNSWEILYGEPFPEKKVEVAPVQPKKEQDPRKVSRVIKAQKPAEPEKNKTEKKTEQKEGQEAAGSGSEEDAAEAAQGEACADSGPDQEHTADIEPADDEDGAAGGAGEDSAGGGEDRESSAGEPDAGMTAEPGEGKGTGAEERKGKMNTADDPEYMSDPEDGGQRETAAEAAGVEASAIRDADGMEKYTENQAKIIFEELQTMRVRCIQHDWDSLIERAHGIIARAKSIKDMEAVWNG